jgi:hypothetical protein
VKYRWRRKRKIAVCLTATLSFAKRAGSSASAMPGLPAQPSRDPIPVWFQRLRRRVIETNACTSGTGRGGSSRLANAVLGNAWFSYGRCLALAPAFLDAETRERFGLTSDDIRASLRGGVAH